MMTWDRMQANDESSANESTLTVDLKARTQGGDRCPNDVIVALNEADDSHVAVIRRLLESLGAAPLQYDEPSPGTLQAGVRQAAFVPSRSLIAIIGPSCTRGKQSEKRASLLKETARYQGVHLIAALLPGVEECDLPVDIQFLRVDYDPNRHGIASVARLYLAMTTDDPTAPCRTDEADSAEVAPGNARERVSHLADYLGRDRKVRAISEFVSYLRDNPHEVHKQIPSRRNAELLTDWSAAETYYASDILRGRIDMTRQSSPDCYVYLQWVWLDDAKRLRAYLNWAAAKQNSREQADTCYYMMSCQELGDTFQDRLIKAKLIDYLPIAEYIADNLLHNGKLAPNKPAAHALIQKKAWCIWKCLGQPHDRHDQNWRDAEAYVRGFYENIGPAIETKDPTATKALLKAMTMGGKEGYRYRIMDCFEAALLIYFLDPEAVETHCGPNAFSL
jgi:hypothetical protein